jgi:hypothetical protein
MGRYVDSVLRPGEQVLAVGRLHWIIYSGAFGCLVAAIVLGLAGSGLPQLRVVLFVLAGIALAGAVIFGVKEWFDQWITEIAVTNFRLIYKRGFIRRYTAEMHMDKIESVTVDQSILGRILGYGTINARGVGVGIEHLQKVASPLKLRNAITAK